MKKIIWIFTASIICLLSCTRTQSHYNKIIDKAESIVPYNPDSALSILETIEPSELTVDSIKAKYYYVVASAHDKQGDLMLSDSLIRYSAEFYKNRDKVRSIGSSTLAALYSNLTGDSKTAFAMLDSLSGLSNMPDSLLLLPLRVRGYLGSKTSKTDSNEVIIKRLIEIDPDSTWHPIYKYWLYIDYLYKENNDSALIVLNNLIDNSIRAKDSSRQFSYEYEKIGVLEELGKYKESNLLADKFLCLSSENNIQHYLHLWKSLSSFNLGDIPGAIDELNKADSCASVISDAEKGYYNSFAFVLRTIFDYKDTGKLRLIKMARINNDQKNVLLRTQSIQREAERSALEIENKRLLLKTKSERQGAIIIIVILLTLLISGALLWYAMNRRRKAMDAMEKAETLKKLVDEINTSEKKSAQNDTLRRAILQQFGIIKMVAETPTEQNREMLRKISSIESNVNDSLVSWENVFNIIDNLYAGFYSRLHEKYNGLLSDKEEQIIVLMVAGFSTKEISVITSQTTSTIYVRKSSIRKKLGVPEKEDIVAYIRQEEHC